MDRKEPDLDCFEKLAVIGRGTYAKVILIKRKGVEGKYYAMKVLKKKYIKKKKQENHVMIERNILATI
jgi:serine/threonine protein kinase